MGSTKTKLRAMNQIASEDWQVKKVEYDEVKLLSEIGARVVDEYRRNLEELFLLRNPKHRYDKNYADSFENFILEHCGGRPILECGVWIYYPWLKAVVHFLEENLHQELRTGRNRNLITAAEQNIYYNSTVAIAGMSVGSHIVTVIAMTGGAKHLRIADFDNLSGDNLNRIRESYANLGINKAVLVARRVLEINPFADIQIFPEGVSEENSQSFVNGVNVIVEEVDSPFWKIRLREMAREKRIPVIMVTDNGDGAIVDVERYDRESNRALLHGKITVSAEEFRHMDPRDLPRVAAKMAGADVAVPRMLESVVEVGETLYSWPQLGTAANMAGTIGAYLVRHLTAGPHNIKSGRYTVSMDAAFEPNYRRKWFSRKVAFIRFIKTMIAKSRAQNTKK
jgi:molybdopterin/thiamine biosynthesis adenylyltransferase